MSRSEIKKRRWRLGLAAVSLCASSAAQGQTVASWLTAVDGSWTEASKWSTNPNYPTKGLPPGSSYRAIIPQKGSGVVYTVTLNSDITLSSLDLGGGTNRFKWVGGA